MGEQGHWLDDDLYRLQFHDDLLHQPLNRRILFCCLIKIYGQLVALGQSVLYLFGTDSGERLQYNIGIDKPIAQRIDHDGFEFLCR